MLAVIILAAGMGTRMRSDLPKMLHEVAGRPMVEHVIHAVKGLDPTRLLLVIGHGSDLMRARLTPLEVEFVEQHERLGTGHALMQCEPALRGFEGTVMVLNGDGPLVRSSTLAALLKLQRDTAAGMSLLTTMVEDPSGLGRIVRNPNGSVARIVEEKDATEAEKNICETNPGMYIFDDAVFDHGAKLSNSNASGEYYITDLVQLYIQAGKTVQGYIAPDFQEGLAANDRVQLAQLEHILQTRIRHRWLRAGVTMLHPETVYITDTAILEKDVIIHPNVHILGHAQVRSGVVIPPNVIIDGAEITPTTPLTPFSVVKNT